MKTIFTSFLLLTFFYSFAVNPLSSTNMLAKRPLLFIENKGQVTEEQGSKNDVILFTTESHGVELFFTRTGIIYQFIHIDGKGSVTGKKKNNGSSLTDGVRSSIYRMDMQLVGANINSKVNGEDKSAYLENYYGADFPDGIAGIGAYGKIVYKNIYPYIDWVIYSNAQEMKYDFVVHPGGNPDCIKIKYAGSKSIKQNFDGSVQISTLLGRIVEQRPFTYQQDKSEIPSRFLVNGNQLSLKVERYDSTKTLTIDPGLVWSTYLGGIGNDRSYGCAVDNKGNVYMTGITYSHTGIALNGYQNTMPGIYACFLSKLSSSGSLLWSTYYNGNFYGDNFGPSPFKCCTDNKGNVYLAGTTTSYSGIAFNGFQNTYGGAINGTGDAFLVKFDSLGTRIWGTYYGGSGDDQGEGCAWDSIGDNIYLAGTTRSTSNISYNGFQNTYGNPFGSPNDAFLVKFSSAGARIWATYYGGYNEDDARSCVVDNKGNVYLSGFTLSTDNIATAGAFKSKNINYDWDAFLVKFNSNGNRLWGTYYGGTGVEWGDNCLTSDKYGNVFLAGYTESSSEIASGGFKNTGNVESGYFVKFDSSGSRLWGSYFNGFIEGIAADYNGDLYLSGTTSDLIGIAAGGFQNLLNGDGYYHNNNNNGIASQDAFLAKFNSNGSRLWGTYFGGTGNEEGFNTAVDRQGNVYLTGESNSLNGVAFGGFQTLLNGDGQLHADTDGVATRDAFLAKLIGTPCKLATGGSISVSGSTNICIGDSVKLTASGGVNYFWNNSAPGATIYAKTTDTYAVTIEDSSGCLGYASVNIFSSAKPSVSVLSSVSTGGTRRCTGDTVTLTLKGGVHYYWANGDTTAFAQIVQTGKYAVTVSNGMGCSLQTFVEENIYSASVSIYDNADTSTTQPVIACQGGNLTLTGYDGETPHFVWSNGASTASISPLQSGTYYITATTSNGCTASTSRQVIFLSSSVPSVSISASPGDTICPGTRVTFTATPINGGASPTYKWTLNGSNTGATGSSYSSSDLTNGNSVSVVMTVSEQCATLKTATSNSIKMSVNSPTPIAKSGMAASTSQFTANWNTVKGATTYFLDVSLHSDFSSFLTGYNNLNAGNVTSYAVAGLNPGLTYYYRVRSDNSCGVSANSNTIACTTTPCPALTGGTVTPASVIICSGTTQLLVLNGASNGTRQWQISPDNVNWTNVSSGGNTGTYTTLAGNGETKEYYRCVSSNACYNAASTSVTVDVSNPNIRVAASSITDKSVTLNWAPAGSGNYEVDYAGASSGTISSATPPVTLTGLTSGSAYNVTVTQTTPAGCPAIGQLGGIITWCAAPTALHVTASTANSISVSWAGPVANYRVYYTQLFSSSVTTLTKDVTGGTSASINSLPAGATYKIYVVQKDCPSAGVLGQPSSFIYGTTTNTTSCASPVIDGVSSACSGQIQIALHGSASNQYRAYIQSLTPVLQAANSYTFNGGSFSVSVASPGQTYLIAAASVCNSSVSNLTIWQPGIAIPAACNGVTNLLLSQPTCVGFTASWNPDNCTSNTLNSYVLYLRKQGSITWNAYSVPSNTLFKAVGTLNPAGTYQCFIRSAYTCNGYVTYGPSSQIQTIATLSSGCRVEDDESPVVEEIPSQILSSSNNESLSLYPNPNAGEFMADISQLSNEDENVRIEVFNMIGQTVLTHLTNISGGHLNELINMPNNCASGMYFVRVTEGKEVYAEKINISK